MIGKQALVGTVARYWPFANGSGRIIDKFGGDVKWGEGERVFRTSDGFDLTVFGDDHIGRHIGLSGKFDRSMIQVLLDFCEPGDRCIDIGANIGYVAGVLLARVPGSHVMCVEPQPAVTGLLRKNLERFPADRWSLLEAALSDADTVGHMQLDHDNRGASMIVEGPSTGTVAVPMVPAAQVLGELERLDVIKMDIEGHEEIVFRSGLREIERLQPRVILWEDAAARSGPSGSIGALLAQAGYRVFGIRKALMATGLETATDENAHGFHDFIALSGTRPQPARAKARYKV